MVYLGYKVERDTEAPQMQTTKNRGFTDDQGACWTVYNVRGVARRSDGLAGMTKCVRTFAVNEQDGREVDVRPGCSYQVEAAVRNS